MLTVSRYVVFSPDLAERSPATFGPNIIFEMWERMTYGGIVVVSNPHGSIWWPRWLPPFVGEAKDGYTEDAIS